MLNTPDNVAGCDIPLVIGIHSCIHKGVFTYYASWFGGNYNCYNDICPGNICLGENLIYVQGTLVHRDFESV